MDFMFLSKPNLSTWALCFQSFQHCHSGNDFWGQNSTPVEAGTTGNLGEQGIREVGDIWSAAAVKELWAPSTRICPRKKDFQGDSVMWLTGNGKQLWMSQIPLFPVY